MLVLAERRSPQVAAGGWCTAKACGMHLTSSAVCCLLAVLALLTLLPTESPHKAYQWEAPSFAAAPSTRRDLSM